MKKKLTLGRRARIVEIVRPLGDGVPLRRKAELVSRGLGEPCSYKQALSLLGQFRGRKKPRGKTVAEIEHERFEKMKAQRTDVY